MDNISSVSRSRREPRNSAGVERSVRFATSDARRSTAATTLGHDVSLYGSEKTTSGQWGLKTEVSDHTGSSTLFGFKGREASRVAAVEFLRKRAAAEWGKWIREAFDSFALPERHEIAEEDVRWAMEALLGVKPSKADVNRLVTAAARESGATASTPSTNSEPAGIFVDYDTFYEFMLSKMSLRDPIDEIRQAFVAMDTRCTGVLLPEDFARSVHEVWPSARDDAIASAYRELDTDHDNRVTFRDFDRLLHQG